MTVDLQAAHTAFVLIAVQRGRSVDGGPPRVRPEVDASKVVIAACREKGMPIMFAQLKRRADGADHSPYLQAPGSAGWTDGTPEVDVADGLAQPNDYFVEKRRQGSFYGSHLEMFLRRNSVDTILMGGGGANAGLESTYREAVDRDFRVVVIRDCVSGGQNEEGKHAIERVFPTWGTVVDLAEALESIRQAK